ncbi:MAG: repressor LexA, partial [Candidatus Hydrogenedentes bacterium]|nr:repressor LexA [Candidatus Hydrogenedentota bacterium]
MAKDLTKRQREILDYIIECVRERGLPPTISEIGEEFGIGAPQPVCR